ncbi:hypothetical protein [Stenotrophomonas sp.]|uniref:hypothetical protein n=1 Tax=Stenotrophomonas sp. TaxID=69392 RepID=UPI00289AE17F|nr:hypothetical protein [Stenotrophomonas sp.]
MDQSPTAHPPFPLACAHQLLTLLAAGKDRLLENLTSRAAHTVVFTFAEGGPQTATVAAA